MTRRSTSLHTADGLELQAEWSSPEDARATAVLCHPHPQFGGTMRSLVTSALFEALPAHGIACLRFNFRGVEGSEGRYAEGREEHLDVVAALDAATAWAATASAATTTGGSPLALIGWSFGADMALGIDDARVTGWVGIAPALRFRPTHEYDKVARDQRPKLLILAANDEFRSPDEVVAETRDWTSVHVDTVPGASHFFVGRTDRVVTLAADFVAGLTRV
jgi:alpha/beta superfamily hydrolase